MRAEAAAATVAAAAAAAAAATAAFAGTDWLIENVYSHNCFAHICDLRHAPTSDTLAECSAEPHKKRGSYSDARNISVGYMYVCVPVISAGVSSRYLRTRMYIHWHVLQIKGRYDAVVGDRTLW